MLEVALQVGLGRLDQARVVLPHVGDERLEGEVVEGPALLHVLHVAFVARVVGVHQRVGAAVELERVDVEALAHLQVEGRRRLYPAALEVHRDVAVPAVHVAADQLAQALGAQVVAHVGEAHARRDAGAARDRGEQVGLGHAVGGALDEGAAGGEVLPAHVEAVGVVADAVAHRVVQLHGALDGGDRVAHALLDEGAHARVLEVEEITWCQKVLRIRLLAHSRSSSVCPCGHGSVSGEVDVRVNKIRAKGLQQQGADSPAATLR